MRDLGHEVVAPDLPFDDPHTGYDERVAPAIDALSDPRDQVVVVGHSLATAYAPLVASRVPTALLVYLCPAPTGPFGGLDTPMKAGRPGFPFPPDRPDGTSVWDPDAAIAAMYPRLPPETAREFAARLKPAGPPAGDYPPTGHPDIPTVLVYASDDEFFEPAWERYVAREVLGIEPIEMPGGHFPMLESPGSLADLLVREAGKRSAQTPAQP